MWTSRDNVALYTLITILTLLWFYLYFSISSFRAFLQSQFYRHAQYGPHNGTDVRFYLEQGNDHLDPAGCLTDRSRRIRMASWQAAHDTLSLRLLENLRSMQLDCENV